MKTLSFILFSFISFFMLTACGSDLAADASTNDNNFAMQVNDPKFSDDQVGQNGDFVKLTDPNENAFTVMMPKGWQSRAYMARNGKFPRSVGEAVSPDGSTRIFFGDAYIPMFFSPNLPYASYVQQQPGAQLAHVKSAANFGRDYIRRSFGQQGQVQVGQAMPDQEIYQFLQSKMQTMGLQANLDVAVTPFSFSYNGQQVRGKLIATVISTQEYWLADVGGFTTTESISPQLESMYRYMSKSYTPNPQWEQQQKIRQQQEAQAQYQRNMQRSQQSFQAHQQRMQMRQQSFNAHQQNMQTLSNINDMQYQSWQNQQNMNDQGQQKFINYLRDENTITNGQYESQVQSGYNYYWVDPNTNQYIGTQYNENPDPTRYKLWKKKN